MGGGGLHLGPFTNSNYGPLVSQVDLGFFSQSQCGALLRPSSHWLPRRVSFGDWLGFRRGERGSLLSSSVSLPGLSLHCLVSPAWHRGHHSIQPVMQVVCSAHLHFLGVQQFPSHSMSVHTHTHPPFPPVSVYTDLRDSFFAVLKGPWSLPDVF